MATEDDCIASCHQRISAIWSTRASPSSHCIRRMTTITPLFMDHCGVRLCKKGGHSSMSEDLYSLYMSSSPTFVSPPLFTTVYLRIRRIFIDRYSLSFIVFIFPCEMRRPCEEPAPSMASTKGGIYIKLLGHGSNIYDNYVIGEKEKEVSRLGDHWRCWGCVHMLGLCLSTCNCTRPQPGVIIVLLSASPFFASLSFIIVGVSSFPSSCQSDTTILCVWHFFFSLFSCHYFSSSFLALVFPR